MRSTLFLFPCILTAAAFAHPDEPTSQPAAPRKPIAADAARKIASTFADNLAAARFDDAIAPFNKRMRSAISAAKLRELWATLAKQCGPFDRFAAPRLEKEGDTVRLIFPAKWKNASLDMHVLISPSGKITGLWFRPAASTNDYKPPAYVHPDRFTERDITIGRDPWTLKGKLSIPGEKSKKPAVILVHGSGPHDMDETIGPNRPFRDLALGLASNGIVVLRYNKRTFAHGEKMGTDKVNVRAEVIDDALAGLAFLREQPDVDPSRIYLIGHSLGGCLAPTIAADDPKLAGIIILAGTLRSMYDVIDDQLAYIASLPGDDQPEAERILKQYRSIRTNTTSRPTMLMGAPIVYWDDLESHLGKNGTDAARKFDGRILILSGGRDYQISRKDFDLWQSALKGRPNVTLHWIPTVNHLFADGIGMATNKDYDRPQFVSPRVVEGIAEWIKSGVYPPEPASAVR